MSDDLVKRLRCYADLNDAVFHPWVYGEAADRIEKLEAALRELSTDWDCCNVSKAMRAIARQALEVEDDPQTNL
jgi:hypothetical protein